MFNLLQICTVVYSVVSDVQDAAQLSRNDLSSASSNDNFSFLDKPQTYFYVQYKQSVILEN